MPKVSVILTSYNHEKHVSSAIDSVLNQTYHDYDLIIWDDCSTDDSWSIISGYDDPRIMRYRNDRNMGGGVIKRALGIASGDFIAIHHSDDIWLPDKLEKQVRFLDDNPAYAAVFTLASIIDEQSNELNDPNHFYATIFNQHNRSRHEWLRRFFFQGNCLCHPSVLIRKECYYEQAYDERLCQLPDFDFWIRLCLKREIYVLQEKLVRFRISINEGNTSGVKPETRKRVHYELAHVLSNYLNIVDPAEFFKIFPECSVEQVTAELIPYHLARLALGCNSSIYQLFGLDTLYHSMGNEPLADVLRVNNGFGYKEFKTLTGLFNVFNYPIHKAQLAVDAGEGYNNNTVMVIEILGNEKCLEFDLSRYKRIKSLRFHPSCSASIVKIISCNVIGNDGTCQRLTPDTRYTIPGKKNLFLFYSANHHLHFIDQLIDNPGRFIIRLEYVSIGSDAHDQIFQIEEDRKRHYSEKDRRIAERDLCVRENEKLIAILGSEIKKRDLLLDSLNNSWSYAIGRFITMLMQLKFRDIFAMARERARHRAFLKAVALLEQQSVPHSDAPAPAEPVFDNVQFTPVAGVLPVMRSLEKRLDLVFHSYFPDVEPQYADRKDDILVGLIQECERRNYSLFSLIDDLRNILPEGGTTIVEKKFPQPTDSGRRLKILIVSGMFPSIEHGGGLRLFDIISDLSQRHQVDMYSRYDESLDNKSYELLFKKLSAMAITYGQLDGAAILKWLQDAGRGPGYYDVIQLEYPESINLVDLLKPYGKKTGFTYMECNSKRFAINVTGGLKDPAAMIGDLLDFIYYVKAEKYIEEKADFTIAVTREDAEFINLISGSTPYILPHGVSDLLFGKWRNHCSEECEYSAAYVGYFDHLPNMDAINWYYDTIHHEVKKIIPGYRLLVIGRGNIDLFSKAIKSDESITFTGPVEDVAEHISRAKICISPLVSGAGLRGKINQYSLLGRPTVSTGIGLCGTTYEHGVSVYRADEPGDFIRGMVTLLTDRPYYDNMSGECRKVVEEHFSWPGLMAKLEALYLS